MPRSRAAVSPSVSSRISSRARVPRQMARQRKRLVAGVVDQQQLPLRRGQRLRRQRAEHAIEVIGLRVVRADDDRQACHRRSEVGCQGSCGIAIVCRGPPAAPGGRAATAQRRVGQHLQCRRRACRAGPASTAAAPTAAMRGATAHRRPARRRSRARLCCTARARSGWPSRISPCTSSQERSMRGRSLDMLCGRSAVADEALRRAGRRARAWRRGSTAGSPRSPARPGLEGRRRNRRAASSASRRISTELPLPMKLLLMIGCSDVALQQRAFLPESDPARARSILAVPAIDEADPLAASVEARASWRSIFVGAHRSSASTKATNRRARAASRRCAPRRRQHCPGATRPRAHRPAHGVRPARRAIGRAVIDDDDLQRAVRLRAHAAARSRRAWPRRCTPARRR